MKEEEKKELIIRLEKIINKSEELWNEKSNAYVVGYLQGSIKSLIIDLQVTLK